MGYVNDLAAACRKSGLTVWESPGWVGRNHGQFSTSKPTAIVCHHTGSSGSGAWTVVRDGRPDLAGPLAQMTLERDGSVRVLSNGQAWHAGTGSYPSIGTNNANSRALGIEAVYNGADITAAQRDAYPRLCAALCRHYGIPVGNVIGHKEWATPRGRKSDPGNVDMVAFRRSVQALVNGGAPASSPAPAPTTAPATSGSTEVSVENYPRLTGKGRLVLGVPVGNGAWSTDGYVSVTVAEGKGSARVYAQGAASGVADWWHPESELTVNTTPGAKDTNLARRSARRIPAGTSVLLVDYDFSAAGNNGGTVTLELK